MEKPTRKTFNCKRCYQSFKSGKVKPKYCAKCKSSLWNTARTYEVVGGELPVKRRTAKTGKAARNASPEYIRAQEVAELEKIVEIARESYQRESEFFHGPRAIDAYLPPILYSLETFRIAALDDEFRLIDLKESDAQEKFYWKRGVLYGERDRIQKEIDRLNELFDMDSRRNYFQDYDQSSVEKYNFYLETIKIRRDELDRTNDRIENLVK
jgi:hypothetical protein